VRGAEKDRAKRKPKGGLISLPALDAPFLRSPSRKMRLR
jgi:hypothetical protein